MGNAQHIKNSGIYTGNTEHAKSKFELLGYCKLNYPSIDFEYFNYNGKIPIDALSEILKYSFLGQNVNQVILKQIDNVTHSFFRDSAYFLNDSRIKVVFNYNFDFNSHNLTFYCDLFTSCLLNGLYIPNYTFDYHNLDNMQQLEFEDGLIIKNPIKKQIVTKCQLSLNINLNDTP